jgi:hypothetical protein
MNAAPERPIRIVLIEEVVLALPENGSIGIVHPIARSEKVIEGPVAVSC